MTSVITLASTTIEDNEVGLGARTNCDNTESTSTGTVGCAADHLIDRVLTGVDGAGQAIAASIGAVNLDTPVGHGIAERSSLLEVDWIPSQLDESVARVIGVGTGNISGPVAPRVLVGTPNTGSAGAHTRRVDVVVCSSSSPVTCSWVGKCCVAVDCCRNQHSFIARQDGLTE